MASRVPSGKRKQQGVDAPVRIPGQPAPSTDNLHGEEAERVQLISFIAKASKTAEAAEAAKVPFDAAKKAHNQVFALAKAANPIFTRKYLEKLMDEMDDPARENPEKLAREAKHRRWLGISVPEQAELQLGDKVPAEDKDLAHWKAEGYKAGLRQRSSTPPSECPERFVQPFMKEHERGYAETTAANAPKPIGTAAQAAKDFAVDNPEVDLDAEAKRLRNDPAFMARGEPEADGDPAPGPDAGFEATADELAAQNPRKAIQEAKAGDPGEVV